MRATARCPKRESAADDDGDEAASPDSRAYPTPCTGENRYGGGITRGGATEKQIKFLHMLADRVGAEPDEESVEGGGFQALCKLQITGGGKPFKDLKVKHTHAAFDEVIFRIGMGIAFGSKVSPTSTVNAQRCTSGGAFTERAKLMTTVQGRYRGTLAG